MTRMTSEYTREATITRRCQGIGCNCVYQVEQDEKDHLLCSNCLQNGNHIVPQGPYSITGNAAAICLGTHK